MSRVSELATFEEVEQAIDASPKVLLDMWGSFCAPCRALRPILEELASQREDWSFVAVNIEHVPAVADKFGVQATPTLLLFKDGTEVDRSGGMILPADLTARMDRTA
jgi:thioredoxin